MAPSIRGKGAAASTAVKVQLHSAGAASRLAALLLVHIAVTLSRSAGLRFCPAASGVSMNGCAFEDWPRNNYTYIQSLQGLPHRHAEDKMGSKFAAGLDSPCKAGVWLRWQFTVSRRV
jgi:hypothetical protein